MTTFPDVRIGDPIRHSALTLFPLYDARPDAPRGVDYVLADEAVDAGSVTVAEVDAHGSVPELLVTNRGDVRALFLEGEELRGAKQDRVLNTSVLVPARGRATIPVSCVERGRWRPESEQFRPGGVQAPPRLRALLKRSVGRSAREGRGHRSDQGAVWGEVDRQERELGVAPSETSAMADTFTALAERLAAYRAALAYPEGASGVAVALGGSVVAVDLFDRPETCRRAWPRLLAGAALGALEREPAGPQAADPPDPGPAVPTTADVAALLDRLAAAPWATSPAVGEGQERRAHELDERTFASALLLDGTLIHGSIVAAG